MTTFTAQKDISFLDDKGDSVPGRMLTASDGSKYKLFGRSAENVELGVEYDFSVKSEDKYKNKLIDGKTFKPSGGGHEAPARHEPKQDDKPFEPQINQQKQTSIEAQHAISKVVELRIAGVIDNDSDLFQATLSYLTDRVMGAGNRVVEKAMSPLVKAAKAEGAVEKKTSQFKNQGDFLNRCHQEYDLQRPAVEARLGYPVNAQTDLDEAWRLLSELVTP